MPATVVLVPVSPTVPHGKLHEQELLAIVRALSRWRHELLGVPFIVHSDHRTLEHFLQQPNLSRRQTRWSEFLSQYDFHIEYIPRPDNTVADALSRLPLDPAESIHDSDPTDPDNLDSAPSPVITPVLTIQPQEHYLDDIKSGYLTDQFCIRLKNNLSSIPGASVRDGLLYIADRLVIPRTGTFRETLFRLAHDTLGHFGTEKSYLALRDSYYWPGMKTDLTHSYVPSCSECQRNKSSSRGPAGPLHPLPVPDA